MRTTFKLILLLMSLLFCGFVNSSDYDWNKVRDEDGVQIYTKKYQHDDIDSFKSIITINAPIDSILAVIIDLNACSDWVHRCKKSILLLRKSFSECYHYQVQIFPFLIQDRDFILHSRIVRSNKSGAILIHMNAVTNFCAQNHYLCQSIGGTSHLIRIKHSHGYYLLEPLQNNVTRVTWVQHSNPGGDIPSWLINLMIQEMPYKTLLALKEKVLEDKYQRTRLIFTPEGKMFGLQLF